MISRIRTEFLLNFFLHDHLICALIFPDLCTQRDDERVFSLITHVSFFEIRADIPRVRVRISHDTPFSPWDVESDEGSFKKNFSPSDRLDTGHIIWTFKPYAVKNMAITT